MFAFYTTFNPKYLGHSSPCGKFMALVPYVLFAFPLKHSHDLRVMKIFMKKLSVER